MLRLFLLRLFLLTAALALTTAISAAERPRAAAESEPGGEKPETVQTPFGPARKAPPSAKPKPKPKSSVKPLVDVEVRGDVALFRRATPFGSQNWTKPLAELTDVEKKFLEESRKASAQAAKQRPSPAAKKAAGLPGTEKK